MQKAKRGRLGSFPALNSSCCSLKGSCKSVQQQQTNHSVAGQLQAAWITYGFCRLVENFAGPWLMLPGCQLLQSMYSVRTPPGTRPNTHIGLYRCWHTYNTLHALFTELLSVLQCALWHLQCDGVEAKWGQPQAGCMLLAGVCSNFDLLFSQGVKRVVAWRDSSKQVQGRKGGAGAGDCVTVAEEGLFWQSLHAIDTT
jgi:hypothetical protein